MDLTLHLNQIVTEKEAQLEQAYIKLEVEPPDDQVTTEIVKAYHTSIAKTSSEKDTVS